MSPFGVRGCRNSAASTGDSKKQGLMSVKAEAIKLAIESEIINHLITNQVLHRTIIKQSVI
ncbi:hypothetical protein [Massilia sp. TS11]|uniref:hypothetical protein n=1 Tax=Massilia sp. TS11 TaxID=2908003 RepID=UPI001EDA2763|nr:hypothetical protein [Massilia sp. TS11]MCG2583927.1 hypothetical protein [Massilia sp. TS11]